MRYVHLRHLLFQQCFTKRIFFTTIFSVDYWVVPALIECLKELQSFDSTDPQRSSISMSKAILEVMGEMILPEVGKELLVDVRLNRFRNMLLCVFGDWLYFCTVPDFQKMNKRKYDRITLIGLCIFLIFFGNWPKAQVKGANMLCRKKELSFFLFCELSEFTFFPSLQITLYTPEFIVN